MPAMGSDDYYAIEMLGALLSGGQSSRLHKELVDEQQLALQVGSFPLPFNEPTVNFTLAFSNMGVDPQDLENAMNAEIEKVRSSLIPDREFQKLRSEERRVGKECRTR